MLSVRAAPPGQYIHSLVVVSQKYKLWSAVRVGESRHTHAPRDTLALVKSDRCPLNRDASNALRRDDGHALSKLQ